MAVRIRGDIVTPREVLIGATLVAGDHGTIEEIVPATANVSGPIDIDATGSLIVPGFVNVHVHGGGGADFMDASEAAVRRVAQTHAKFGTTTLLATTLTATRQQIDKTIEAIRFVMNHLGDDEAKIAGIHLEGPYICAAKRGAQPFAPIRPPDWVEMQEWIGISDDAIKLITLAPEIDGVLEFIKMASARGIVVSVGHTNATYDQTISAIDTGATHATHLFNAMPPLHHRQPGAVGALLDSNNVLVELICDGVHLHPSIVRTAVKAAGADRVILITDAISGAGMPDGEYELGGTPVIVKEGTAKFADGTLAGSVLTMNRAFANVQEFARVSVPIAAAMASRNAAWQFGLYDRIGSLEVGKSADFAVIDPISGSVQATMREGNWIYQR